MRFAWLRENSGDSVSIQQGCISRLIYLAYNIIYPALMVLPFAKIIDYRTGFVAFFVFILFRAAANMYRNNFLTLAQAEVFPLRSP